jgi:hypothetical protein
MTGPARGIMLVALKVAHLPEHLWPWVNLAHIAAIVPITDTSTEIRFTGDAMVTVSLSAAEIVDVMRQAASYAL